MSFDTQTRSESAVNLVETGNPAKSASITAMGIDIGNGSLKMVSELGQTRIDSYIYYLNEKAAMSANSGYVEYRSGIRSDLIGKQWVGGLNAYYHGLRAAFRVTDTPTGKADLGLQLFLSTLSVLPYRPEWNLSLVCSVHDGEVLGKKLQKALEGSHSIVIANKPCKVSISVKAVLEEGSGAIINYQRDCDTTNALVYDLGNGTLIVSGFSGLRGYLEIRRRSKKLRLAYGASAESSQCE